MLPLPFLNISVISFWECMTGAWFSKSISHAKRKEIQNHQIWIVRHVASSIWVAVQRLLMGPSAFATNKIAALIGANVTAGYKHRIIFYTPMFIGQCVTFAVGEYAVHLLGKNMKKGKRAWKLAKLLTVFLKAGKCTSMLDTVRTLAVSNWICTKNCTGCCR